MITADSGSRKIFSIILATYNCGQKIESTVESILSQDRNLFELIVVDGASTDDTLEYVKKFENDLKFVSEKDNGVYDAFNKGINCASGEYLYFIGAGDKMRENVLEIVSKSLLPAAPAFLYGDAYVVKDKFLYGGEFNEERLKKQNICHQAIFYHRRIFDLLGKYDLRYDVFADWALNLKCFGDRRIEKQYLQSVIVDFEGGGLSTTIGDAVFKKDFPRLVKKYLGVKSYISYKYPNSTTQIYRKVYFPFVRPFVRAVRRIKNSGRG